ncbi:MAG: ATPase F0F1 [Bacteroidetes bacterium HGW-Bacteroidetes-1]|jgi:F0F1-type ATP synthase assembly protein I|nr:MAG: ATPase F0F1 [Bacteroidetes bacterium HGW-Bacteroidetes-1]
MLKINNNKSKKAKDSLNSYARYSSLAFQMMFIILLSVYGGVLLDRWTGWSFPLFKLLLSLFGVVFAIYYAVKDFLKKP